MTDDFDKLRAALRATPPPDPANREAAMQMALKNFDRFHQGNADPVRPSQDRPSKAGSLKGLGAMLSKLTSRPLLAATTSAAALCLGLIVVLPAVIGSNEPALQGLPKAVKSPEPALFEPAPEVMADAAVAPTDRVVSPAPSATEKRSRHLSQQTTGGMLAPAASYAPQTAEADLPVPMAPNTERFATADANPIKITAQEPVSTFSIDVDTASYAVVRSSLMRGQMPPEAAVRLEEMINYFPYDYPAPALEDAPFKPTVTVMPTPWNAGTRLVRIGVQGRLPALDARPPLNLVFLIDTSGSMNSPDKLPLLKQSLRLMLPQLRLDDEVAIVTYAGSAGEVLPPTRAADANTIMAALDRLGAGGSTAGAEGLELAYRVAEKMTAQGEVSRVLLATDGDFNVGVSDPDGLENYIAKKREGGTYLSVLGFGRGNLDDETMQALAQSGNGLAAYIDTLQEARKVLVDQLSGALFPIADDVKIQVEWNPAQVAEYRLIGYETRALAREDFNNDKVDAGEVGAGHSVTALYEVTAPGSSALANDPLRYGPKDASPTGSELGFLRLRYKAPGEKTSALMESPIVVGDTVDDDARFAAAIAGFGQLLTGAKYLGDWGWDAAIDLALDGRGDDAFGYRAEAISMMRLAQSLTSK